MGRRAKTKQGDPAPLVEVQENAGRPSQKKLGKRKADDGESASKRPAKKVKETAGGTARPGKLAAIKSKDSKKSAPKGALKANADKSKPKTQARFDQEDDEDEGEGSSDGWEDVEDDD